MADGILKKHNTVSASGDLAAPEAQAAPKNAFVIRPAPTGVPSQAEDSIYQTEHTAPYAEAAQPGTSGDIQVSSAMLCGNISLLSEEDILRASDTYNLVIAGQGGMPCRPGRKIHYYETIPTEEKFRQLFDAFDIDTVWYISGYADCQNGMHDEMKILDSIMDACAKNAVSKLIVVTSITSLNFQPKYDIMGQVASRAYASGEAFAVAQLENYIRYCAKSQGIKTIILRAPYIASETNRSSFLGHIFSSILHGEKLVFPYCPENKIDFLSSSDLMELFLDISEESADSTATYSVASGYHYTWKDLENEILKVKLDAVIEYEEKVNFISVQSYSIELKRKYGFIPMDNVLNAFPAAFKLYKETVRKKSWAKVLFRKISDAVLSNALGYIELAVLFLLAEFLVRKTASSVYFKYVDIRLFYVLIMGTTHGTLIGILAGILAGIALFFGYRDIGINGTMLFYNIENWLPFVIYLMTGSITGYISTVRRQKNEFLQKENSLLRDKYLFLNDVYHGAIANKSEYKRQILGYKDSFGVIFQAVRKLDSVLPHEIFMNGIQTMEGILKNHSIAIYTIDSWQKYGRLAASSGDILAELPKSLEIAAVQPVYDTVLAGQTWKNTGLLPGLPMYAYGICEKDKVSLLICIYDASPEQMSLYYLNLFSILCNLIKLSFIRALEYQRAIEQEKYYPGTLIVIPSYFRELLNAQKELAEAGLASYALIRFESKDKEYISSSLKGLVRNNDIVGADDNGSLFLILTQTTRKAISIVGERLDNKGLKYKIVSGN
ncbi:NAD-dependent epimerase/dehydratase family protein [Oscillibacter sp.]|uniref:NAD-dependent epimerase/dehydratase family protein n=1 Tax=Oscillibacter sp. TaxID=1945593 RepID=UPI001B549B43|nr:NAD-dependent epimerase/dehydratase family protein [Oscillibacter sp.]MBP3508237.1 NAD(P)-dependent oxidoreductase [Oscillibacter sp.]